MAESNRLYVRRIDVVAAPDDQVLQSPFDPEVAAGVHDAKIAGQEPAAAVETTFRHGLVAKITQHERGTSAADVP